MNGAVERLPWDSQFFGVMIGSVQLEGATTESLSGILDQARDLGIDCLYGTLDQFEADEAFFVQEAGFRLVEVALRFGRPAGPFTPKVTTSTVRRGNLDDLARLDEAIATLSPWSRFAADPRFGPEAANRMFRAWVERAAGDGEEHMLLVAEDESGITGLSTNVRHPVPRVDLMGVTKPGSGASWALMDGLIRWAEHGLTEAGPCAARNIAVLRYVENCGFRVVASQYKFHRWLDDPDPDRAHRG